MSFHLGTEIYLSYSPFEAGSWFCVLSCRVCVDRMPIFGWLRPVIWRPPRSDLARVTVEPRCLWSFLPSLN